MAAHSILLGEQRVLDALRISRTARVCRITVCVQGVAVIIPRDADDGRAATFLQENAA